MKIKQRKNYIHLVVSGVPLFSTLETLQEERVDKRGRGGGGGCEWRTVFALVSFSFSPLHQRARQGLYSDNRAILSSWLLLSVFPPLIISRVSHAGGKRKEKKKWRRNYEGCGCFPEEVLFDFKSNSPETKTRRERLVSSSTIVATKRCIVSFFSRTLRKQF